MSRERISFLPHPSLLLSPPPKIYWLRVIKIFGTNLAMLKLLKDISRVFWDGVIFQIQKKHGILSETNLVAFPVCLLLLVLSGLCDARYGHMCFKCRFFFFFFYLSPWIWLKSICFHYVLSVIYQYERMNEDPEQTLSFPPVVRFMSLHFYLIGGKHSRPQRWIKWV